MCWFVLWYRCKDIHHQFKDLSTSNKIWVLFNKIQTVRSIAPIIRIIRLRIASIIRVIQTKVSILYLWWTYFFTDNSISSQNDKIDDGKLNEGSLSSGNSTNSSVANKAVIGSNVTPAVNASTEIAKDAINIEETSALKD